MKKIIYSLMAAATMLASCSDFTEIDQKGVNLLSYTDDLELLLNKQFAIDYADVSNLGGELIYTNMDMGAAMTAPNKVRNTYILCFFDDPQDLSNLATLTNNDVFYSNCYNYIGTVCNPLLNQLATVSGPEAKKNTLRAEALAWRAYTHFLVLQKFAKAYNPATAASDRAVIYMTEDCNLVELQSPKTVKECLDLCLKDINDAIALDVLPVDAVASVRMNKPAAYAIKAHICMAMQDYAGAQKAVDAALAINGNLHNYYSDAVQDTDANGCTFYYTLHDCIDSEEVYTAIPVISSLNFVSTEAQVEAEKGYAMIDLMYYDDVLKPVEDYGAQYGLPGWKCSRSVRVGNYWNASGLSVPMMYLLKAETQLRQDDIDNAMASLDILRKSRLPEADFTPLQGAVTTKDDAIARIKQANVGENLWGPWLFIQRKRWNIDSEWKSAIIHVIAGQIRTLSPESDLWVFPFPTRVLEANPNLKNNTNK